jgi:hypothetical protein
MLQHGAIRLVHKLGYEETENLHNDHQEDQRQEHVITDAGINKKSLLHI